MNWEHANGAIVSILGINDRAQVMSLCRFCVLKLAASKFPVCKFQLSNIQTLDVGSNRPHRFVS